MQLQIERQENTLLAFLSGELDHHSAKSIRQELDETILCAPPKKLILDFSGISFMDSSGIGLVMGRYKLLKAKEGTIELYGLSPHIYKVMHLAGMEQISTLHKESVPKSMLTKAQEIEERKEESAHETYA